MADLEPTDRRKLSRPVPYVTRDPVLRVLDNATPEPNSGCLLWLGHCDRDGYGRLGPLWRDDLRRGFAECFRVLEPEGVLVFKWNETQVRLSEVLALTPMRPLFSGHRLMTHWLVFMKPVAAGDRNGEALAAADRCTTSQDNPSTALLRGTKRTKG